MTIDPPVIHAGTTVRLSTGRLMSVARVVARDEDGHVTAAIDLLPYVDDAPPPPPPPVGRPSPPTGPDCSCAGERAGRPVAHHGLCPRYTVEDHAWCLTRWVDAKTGRAPTYAEALATLRGGASASDEIDDLPAGYAVPSRSIAVGQRCGTCPQCRGLMADPRCRYERIVVERDAVRRAWCHVQAINPAALDATSAHIYGLLVDEIRKISADTGIK